MLQYLFTIERWLWISLELKLKFKNIPLSFFKKKNNEKLRKSSMKVCDIKEVDINFHNVYSLQRKFIKLINR